MTEEMIKSKKILCVREWNNQLIINDLDETIIVDLAHTDLGNLTITIKSATETKKKPKTRKR